MFLFQSGFNVEQVIMRLISICIILFLVTPLHECGHAFIAYKFGDPTAKHAGRLTLNPIASFDLQGSLFIILFGIGWGKPVPVNYNYFKHRKTGIVCTALAGPAVNMIFALAVAFIFNLIIKINAGIVTSEIFEPLYIFFYFLISISVGIGLFNLIPLPPLDGSKVIIAFLPKNATEFFQRYQTIFSVVLLFLCFFGAFNGFLGTAQTAVTHLFLNITYLG